MLNYQKIELAKRFKEGHNTSGEYTGANVVKDSRPINICF